MTKHFDTTDPGRPRYRRYDRGGAATPGGKKVQAGDPSIEGDGLNPIFKSIDDRIDGLEDGPGGTDVSGVNDGDIVIYNTDTWEAGGWRETKAFWLETPAAADDLPLIRVDRAVTLTKVVFAITGGTNWIGQLVEADDAQGTNAINTQSSDSTVTGTTTVTSFSNASIAAGHYIRLKTTSVSGSVTWLHVTFYYI